MKATQFLTACVELLVVTSVIISCQNRKSDGKIRDLNFEYVKLSSFEIDSIYNSHLNDVVFLSFYPGMHNDIYRKYLKLEQQKHNLRLGASSSQDGLFYTFYIDSTSVYDPLFSSKTAIAMVISMNRFSVNLQSRKPISSGQFSMATNLYSTKYGRPKDTVINNQRLLLFSNPAENKIVTVYLDKGNLLNIDYYTRDSLFQFQKKMKEKELEDERDLQEWKDAKSVKEEVLEKI